MTRARRGTPVERAQAATAERGGEAEETRPLTSPPPEVSSRFALAAARMADAWLRAGGVRVSTHDFRIARDFLERDGWTVEELPGVFVRLRCGDLLSDEMTREAAVLVALRRLVAPGEWRRRALRRGGAHAPPPVEIPADMAPRPWPRRRACSLGSPLPAAARLTA